MQNLNGYKEAVEKEEIREKALKEKLQLIKELFFLKDLKELQKTKAKLKAMHNNIQNMYQEIDDSTTFSKQDFIPFLLDFLKLTKNKDMEFSIFIEPNPLRFILKEEICEYLLLGEKEPIQQIKRMFGEFSLSESIEKVKREDYLVVPIEKEKIHMADGLELRKEFQFFPELQYVFERMIELSKDDSITQKEKLDILLEEVRKNKEIILKREKNADEIWVTLKFDK